MRGALILSPEGEGVALGANPFNATSGAADGLSRATSDRRQGMGEGGSFLLGAAGGRPQSLLLRMANRHGLIAGATGTGKTVTLQNLAEGFSAAGVPVFAADVKGDLAGLAMAGSPTSPIHDKLTARAREIGLADYSYADNPAVFWDLFGAQGHPIRTTVSEMGPLLLARLMGLSEAQEGVLSIVFRYADDQGLLLLNLDDLQSLLTFAGDNASTLTTTYGNVTRPSVGAIQRQLLQLESQGGEQFFGEPAFDIVDLIRTDPNGRGIVSILAADKLMTSPRLYSTFLLWLMSELFERLPEVGDRDKPVLVFFFDEAHLLFEEAPRALVEKIEQVVRLIRSKGVGIWFITQNPSDIPEDVAGQLGNRVQHALRAFTALDQKAVKAAAATFRPNPGLDAEAAITELKTGEALVSLLDEQGAPAPVERALIRPPRSRVGPLSQEERAAVQAGSPIGPKYDAPVDRESAEEILNVRAEAAAAAAAKVKAEEDAARAAREAAKAEAAAERERRRNPSLQEEMVRQVGRSMQRQLTNRIAGRLIRGILGGLFGGR
jgi:DNA helicase HerA-like ATPase